MHRVRCAGQAGFKLRLLIQVLQLIAGPVMALISWGIHANERHSSDHISVRIGGMPLYFRPALFAIGDQIAIVEIRSCRTSIVDHEALLPMAFLLSLDPFLT